MVVITNLSLSFPAFTASLIPNEILAAFEPTKVEDVEKWTMAIIGTATLAKNMVVYKMDRN
jgi:hypothetical protein